MNRLAWACVGGALVSAVLLAQDQAPRGSAASRREDAYRQNNIGVARLEQYDYAGATEAFHGALSLQGDLAIARLNLAIAHLYEGQLDAAEREARAALARLPSMAQPQFVLGLIARAANRPEDAASAFQEVVALDASDAGSRVQLGQVRLGQRQFAAATTLFAAALTIEPFNATAAYGVAVALTRGGDRERGEQAMKRFQGLRDNPAAVTYSSTYLEQGRYGEAIASTGLEPELVDAAVPAVSFADATGAMVPGPHTGVRSVSLTDIDADGDVDFIAVGAEGVDIFRQASGRFTATAPVRMAGSTAALAGDYDNDGARDLLVLAETSVALFRQESGGTFRDVTAAALPAGTASARAAAFVDADHDGDLDIVLGARLLRNTGNGRFQDATGEARLPGRASPAAIVPTDFDNRRDVDLLFVGGAPALFSNQRDGTFRNVTAAAGLPAGGSSTVVAVADINKDTAPDFFFAGEGNGVFASSGAGGRFAMTDAPAGTAGATAAVFVDYDNDGLSDLLVLTARGARLWRSMGSRWVDVTATAFPRPLVPASDSASSMGAADLDGDGDEDVLVRLASGGLRLWRNDGGNRRKSVRVRLAARVSNKDAIGAKVELRAGSLRQKVETFATTPAVAPADVVIGLGARSGADVVRVLWPAGILQAETELATPLVITELDRKPSSCPFLYTWNGTRFEFQTDFLGGGEMGYWVAPGVRNVPDPDEFVRVPGHQLRARDGRYELRITNELEEAMFLDRVHLVAVSHPADVEVYPNEGLRSPDRRPGFALYTSRRARPPVTAIDEHGHDVLDRIAARDRRYVDDFRRAAIQGYADEHSLTIDTGARTSDSRVLLMLTGWTDYAFSSDNVAAQQAGLTFVPPALEARNAAGEWHMVMPELGLPVGRPQTVVVDVTPFTRTGAHEFRITTTLRVYWDEVLVDTSDPASIALNRLEVQAASVRWRGFSAEVDRGPHSPPSYDYDRVSPVGPWKLMPGRYTRYGDVTPLLRTTDDQFVIAAPGDEIAVAFDATALPPPADGWTRTFLLYTDGFSKEMNLYSASPDVLEPLPFHAMSAYPYTAPESYPETPEHTRYRDTYNTRVIRRGLPPLETSR